MTYRTIIALLFIFSFYACSNHSKQQTKILGKRYNGVYLSDSGRHGRIYKDTNGNQYAYTYISTIISNDTLIPINIQMAFSNDYNQNGQPYKVFLLPEIMTVEKQRNEGFYNNKVRDFINKSSKTIIKINKVINPNEAYHINIGVLCPYERKDDNMGPQFSLFSDGHKLQNLFFSNNFISSQDSLLIASKKTKNQINLWLGLSFSLNKPDTLCSYSVIPCGQITFSEK
jgi:hypothetical protein